MEFLYDRFAEWMKQRLVRQVLTSLLHNIVSIALAMFLAVTMSTMAVRAIMPVERSRMFLVPSDGADSRGDHDSLKYYGFINIEQSPSAGFPYKVDLVLRPPVLRGKIRLKLRSSSGMVIVDKSAGFKVNVGGAGAATTQFSLGRLLAPIYDGTLQLLPVDRRNEKNDAPFAHIELRFSLDCSAGDMYTRLLCFRPTKWAVVAWTWAALYSAVMTIAMSFLLATKIMNFFLTEFARALIRWAGGTVRRQGARLLRRVRGRSVPAGKDDESVDELIEKIRAAAAAGASPQERDHISYTSIGEDSRKEEAALPTIVIDAVDSVEDTESQSDVDTDDVIGRESDEEKGADETREYADGKDQAKGKEHADVEGKEQAEASPVAEGKEHPVAEAKEHAEETAKEQPEDAKGERDYRVERPDAEEEHRETEHREDRAQERLVDKDARVVSGVEQAGKETIEGDDVGSEERQQEKSEADSNVDKRSEHADVGADIYTRYTEESDVSAKQQTPRESFTAVAGKSGPEEGPLDGRPDGAPNAELTCDLEEDAQIQLANIVKLLDEVILTS